MKRIPVHLFTFAALLALSPTSSAMQDSGTERDLAGLWRAKRQFGPEVRGHLALTGNGDRWEIEINGRTAPATAEDGRLRAELPGGEGSLSAPLPAPGVAVTGHWTQPRSAVHGVRYLSPVRLVPDGEHRWSGEVVPFDDEFTLYLPVSRREDGSLGAFLRNPERNQGVFWNLDRLDLVGEQVRWVGRFRNNDDEIELARGVYREDDDRLSVYFGSRGGTYDFERQTSGSASPFHPRGGSSPGRYEYRVPPARSDGWKTGRLDEVGLSLGPLRDLVETHFSEPPKSVHDPYPHGLLIARSGKLVFEEYFHGFHRDRPHDTRSASKSVTAVLAGAAIHAGLPLSSSTPVYATLDREAPDLDERKRRMTLEDLLTMSSGLACNDSDPASPGNEETMQEQTEELDWYAFALDLPAERNPGQEAFYCSATANLAGGVISAATGEHLAVLFDRLVAEPLQVGRYHLPLAPAGHPYMGGGIRWLPRDFMKLGQLMLDGGTWNGRRVISEEWARRSVESLFPLRERRYGYLWWIVEYPYQDRTVRAFFAGGNGGQVVIGVPELDLLVAFFAGNYSDRTLFRYQEEFFPQYILPAVR